MVFRVQKILPIIRFFFFLYKGRFSSYLSFSEDRMSGKNGFGARGFKTLAGGKSEFLILKILPIHRFF